MSRRILQPIIFAALLSLGASPGAATGVRAASDDSNGAAGSTQVLTAPGTGIGASLPTHGLVTWLLAGADPDARVGRPGPARNPGRVRLNPLRPTVCRSHHSTHDDAGTRLARAGLHSSSLGTPPPQS